MKQYTTLRTLLLVILFGGSTLALQGQSSVCAGENVILSLSGFTGTIQWEEGNSSTGPFTPMSGVTGNLASIQPAATAWYRAAVTNGTCNPFYSDTIEVVVFPGLVVNAGLDQNLCEGSAITLGGSPSASGGTAPYTYAWSPAAGLSNATDPNPSASPISATTYTLSVTDSNGCSVTDDVVVSVQATPLALAGNDTTIACGDSVQLSASASGGTAPYSYAWTGGSLSNPGTPNPWASPLGTATYSLLVTDANGCTGEDTVVVSGAGGSGSQTFSFVGTIDTSFVAPCADSIVIEVWGAEGGNNTSSSTTPGMGAYQRGAFALAPGTRLKILVGEKPSFGGGNGGGGGSFVTLTNNSPLIIAGGGGGSSGTTDSPDKHGQAGQNGGTGAAGGGTGGTAGSGGNIGASGFQSGAGGGLLGNGTNGWTTNTGGLAFVNGGSGGTANSNARGGFGGGGSGSSYVVGGAGGGYSGGGSGGNSSAGVGGGGGSYNAGTNPISTAGARAGHGQVIITW